MKQTDPQYKLRMPVELKALIDEAAKENHRSINAEIIARLAASFNAEVVDFALAIPPRSAAGTSIARPLALGNAESLLEAALAAFREEQIMLLTSQLIAEIELTAVLGEETEFDLTMTSSITDNIDKLAALKGTDPLQEYAALMGAVERRLEESRSADANSSGAKRIRRTRKQK